ncbi:MULTISPECIES: helix-turn-helix transcriptional regulator [Roseibium]|uniref:helix-turn-helix domain-containing protein n=1 Tax=Roseibium TaxID=150830 RepID=UPI0032669A61
MNKSPIKLAKELTGFTGEKLAEALGVSPPHLSRMTSKKRRITTDHIEKLAAISGKTTEEFYQLLGTTPAEIEDMAEALTGHPTTAPLMLEPDIFKRAYDRARAIEETMLGGRGSNADFAVILEKAYADLTDQKDD